MKINYRKIMSRSVLIALTKIKVFLYRFLLSDNSPTIRKSKICQAVMFSGRGEIILDDVSIGIYTSQNVLDGSGYLSAKSIHAKLIIGKGTVINNNATIIADKSTVIIGKRCLIGPNFFCCDSDFHGITIAERTEDSYKCFDVRLGDDVFIGEGVRVLKGVTIGSGSIIGCGSLVVNDVAENSIYAGNPAKLIKKIS